MKNKLIPNDNVPFQIQNIIDGMLNTKDNVYVRGNYRTRLDVIRTEIDKAIRMYDNEKFTADYKPKHKRA